MTISEFPLIDRYFKSRSVSRNDVLIGIGDDAAITSVPVDMHLVSAMDTMVSGVHFPEDTSAFSIGYKSLAVNLSDLAAMGAEPAWAMIALTLPEADEEWVAEFCDGFFKLADQFNVALIGGDTTRGPLTISVQVMGLIPTGKAITRDGANVGDIICVSGSLGEAAAAVYSLDHKTETAPLPNIGPVMKKLEQPMPRVTLGLQLRDIATAAIDVSDGLVADLNHILVASGVGATLYQDKIPVSDQCKNINSELSLDWALTGGDDYELCFTVAEKDQNKIQQICRQLNVTVSFVGVVEQQKKIRLLDKNVYTDLFPRGYQHFSKP